MKKISTYVLMFHFYFIFVTFLDFVRLYLFIYFFSLNMFS